MMEITLCIHNEIKTRCALCRKAAEVCVHDIARYVYCEDCAGDARSMRACGDCLQYVRVKDMIKKSDGRVICSGCQKAIDQKARERAQTDLFVTQPSMF